MPRWFSYYANHVWKKVPKIDCAASQKSSDIKNDALFEIILCCLKLGSPQVHRFIIIPSTKKRHFIHCLLTLRHNWDSDPYPEAFRLGRRFMGIRWGGGEMPKNLEGSQARPAGRRATFKQKYHTLHRSTWWVPKLQNCISEVTSYTRT